MVEGIGGPIGSFQATRATIAAFVTERDWHKFHTPRNVMLALSGEVGELSEIWQWKGSGIKMSASCALSCLHLPLSARPCGASQHAVCCAREQQSGRTPLLKQPNTTAALHTARYTLTPHALRVLAFTRVATHGVPGGCRPAA